VKPFLKSASQLNVSNKRLRQKLALLVVMSHKINMPLKMGRMQARNHFKLRSLSIYNTRAGHVKGLRLGINVSSSTVRPSES